MTVFPNADAWRNACAADAVLGTWAGPWAVCFEVASGSDTTVFNFVEGQVAADPGTPAFVLAAPEATWARFLDDITFYSGEWDARERVGRIDTNKCRPFMLTGEYDYPCTVELSAATAAKIPGVRFQAMPGIGHFPFAENPKRFAEYLLPILAELKG